MSYEGYKTNIRGIRRFVKQEYRHLLKKFDEFVRTDPRAKEMEALELIALFERLNIPHDPSDDNYNTSRTRPGATCAAY